MNIFMKKLSLLFLAAVSLTSCWTSIWTVAPTDTYHAKESVVYTTQVTTPSPRVTTTTTFTVTSYNDDMSFYLDLNAVAAAFAESNSVQEFERILNSSRYMINNLDLNRDGWVDYLRVIEAHQGIYHTLLIQACLAPGVFQDVATLVAEYRPQALYVEVIGDRWLYGPNYIVRPVFVKRPPIWDVYGRPTYAVWTSPYYYGYWPTYYTQPKPIYLNHYQAYVTTYMHNHHYCHSCEYPSKPYYGEYVTMIKPNSHREYATQHPNDSFERRVTETIQASTPGRTVSNAGQLRQVTETKSATGTSARSGNSTSTTTTTGTKTGTSSTTSARSGNSTTKSTTTTKSAPSTTVDTRVNKSGTTRTTIKTTDASGRTTTTKREASTRSTTSKSARGTTSAPSQRSGQQPRSTIRR